MQEPIEIRDPGIDPAALGRRIEAQVAQRRANGSYDAALARLSTLPQPEVPEVVPAEFPGLTEALLDLTVNCFLYEPSFRSSAPVVGPLIVAMRRGWNWMSTKWYVLPVIWQQSIINARLSSVIGQMAQWAEINARQTAALRRQVAELEARLAKLEQQ